MCVLLIKIDFGIIRIGEVSVDICGFLNYLFCLLNGYFGWMMIKVDVGFYFYFVFDLIFIIIVIEYI